MRADLGYPAARHDLSRPQRREFLGDSGVRDGDALRRSAESIAGSWPLRRLKRWSEHQPRSRAADAGPHPPAGAAAAEVSRGVLTGLRGRSGRSLPKRPGRRRCPSGGVDDQAGPHVVGQLPADQHPSGQVDHDGQVEPALTGAQVGDVADQPVPRGVRRAAESRSIRSGISTVCSLCSVVRRWPRGCTAGSPSSRIRSAIKPTEHLMPSLPIELGGDPAAARRLPGCLEHPPHMLGQHPPSCRGRGLDPVPPAV